MLEKDVDELVEYFGLGGSRYPYTDAYDKVRSIIGGSRSDIAQLEIPVSALKRISVLKSVEDSPIKIFTRVTPSVSEKLVTCLKEAHALVYSSWFTKPIFAHDCNSCMFLGTSEEGDVKTDLYYCPQSGLSTIIARYGNDGPDYVSGVAFAKKNVHLARAKFLAEERGLDIVD